MGVWEIVLGALVLVFSIIMIIVIILQEGHQAGLGTITGGADSFLSRGKARTADAIFARVTKYCAIAFFVFVVVLNVIQYFGLANWSVSKDNESSATSSVVSEVSTEVSESDSSAEESKAEQSKTDSSAEESKAEESKTDSSVAESSVAESSAAAE